MPSWAKWGLSLLVAVGIISIGWRVIPVLVTLHILVCFVLIIVIMLQSGSAADLAGAFGGAGSQTAFGPRGAATFLSRATTWCAIVFMMTSLALSVKRSPNEEVGTGSVLEQTQKSGTAPAPAKPAQAPIQIPIQPSQQPSSPPTPAPAQQPAPSPAPKK
jgi:preprotein translocase subunit SecG